MNAPGFAIPCAAPLLPVTIDMTPMGLRVTQGLAVVVLDQQGVDGLLQVAGILTLMRLGAQAQAAAQQPGVILQ